jgi:asparagine synthase (glutamine-hydrolysing)
MCGFLFVTDEKICMEKLQKSMDSIVHRGPDETNVLDKYGKWIFHRLSIMDLSHNGMQPFSLGESLVICNGEIYNFRTHKEELKSKYDFHSGSDCEILLPLYKEMGLDFFRELDAEFALVMYDAEKGKQCRYLSGSKRF